jgi:hypothetical protein
MTAEGIVATVSRLGGTIEPLDGDRLRVRPPGILTPNLRAALQAERQAVLTLLRLLAAPPPDPPSAEIIAEVERYGAGLYLRPPLGLVIWHGERIDDALLRRLVEAAGPVEQIIRARYASGDDSPAFQPSAEADRLLGNMPPPITWHPDWPRARPSAFPRQGRACYILGGKAHFYAYDEDDAGTKDNALTKQA